MNFNFNIYYYIRIYKISFGIYFESKESNRVVINEFIYSSTLNAVNDDLSKLQKCK